jgi:hypothetical protein
MGAPYFEGQGYSLGKEGNHRLRKSGQSLHEYAIAAALLVVVSIVGLKLLGGSLSNLLGKTANPSSKNETEQLYALIDTNIGGSGQSTTATASQTKELLIRFNSKTGQVDITDVKSDGTNSTSVEGGGEIILAMSSALAQLAETPMGNGDALPDDIQAMIRQLAYNGTQLGTMYDGLQQQQAAFMEVNRQIEAQALEGKYGGPPYYDSAFVDQMIQHSDQYIQLAQTYQKLEQRLGELAKTDQTMAALQDKISGYSGAITGINHTTIGVPTFGQFSIDNVRREDLTASLSKAPEAMRMFAPLAEKTQSAPPAQRIAAFQKSFVAMGQQMLSGKRIDSPQGLSISLPELPAAIATQHSSDN